jgi:DinB superfamily
MEAAGLSLVTAFDYVWDRFRSRVNGLTDDEYFWQPVPDCWTIRPDSTGRWVMDGASMGPDADLDPMPVTTIAWRIGHLAGSAVAGFTQRLFGGDAPGELPRYASEVPDYLDACYGPWRAAIGGLSSEQWGELLGPAWGPYATATKFDLSVHVFDEVVHHAAEVGLLRDLYGRLRS